MILRTLLFALLSALTTFAAQIGTNTVPLKSDLAKNLLDFGTVDRTGVTDCASALSNAIVAASAVSGGAEVYIPAGRYAVSGLSLTASNFRLTGQGTLICPSAVTNWLTISGTNIAFEGLTFDGQQKAITLLNSGDYNGDWRFKSCRFLNAYADDTNDPGKAASVNGFMFRKGFRGLTVDDCLFYNITYSGQRHTSGVERFCAGIYGVTLSGASTNDHLFDIEIKDCRFINVGTGKIDADAIRIQGYDISLYSGIRLANNYFDGSGWRAIKMLIGGGIASDNYIISQEPGPVATRAMFAAIGIFGSNWSLENNWAVGGAIYRPFDAESTSLGRVENVSMRGNHAILPSGSTADSDAIYYGNVRGGTIEGNQTRNARIGINLQGWNEGIAVGPNSILNTGLLGVYLQKETTGNAWTNQYANNCTITATAADGYSNYAVQADAGCTNITVVGTQGSGGFGSFNRGSGVTGESAANTGSLLPLKAQTSNANYYLQIDANASGTDSIVFTGPFANRIAAYSDTGKAWSFGSTSGTVTINGTMVIANNVKIVSGSGSPEGVVTAAVGSLYSRTDGGAGTSLYVKQSGSGNTGWAAK